LNVADRFKSMIVGDGRYIDNLSLAYIAPNQEQVYVIDRKIQVGLIMKRQRLD